MLLCLVTFVLLSIQAVEPTGEFVLVAAKGQNLPAVVSESPGFKQEVTGGSIHLSPDGTFTWSTAYRYTTDGSVETSESSGSGTYTRGNAWLVFKLDGGAAQFQGALDGDKLTLRTDVEMVFQRRGPRASS